MRKSLLVFMVGFMGLALSACSYSDGQRAGTVSKFSHKGLVCKSWEGELVMGGVREQTGKDAVFNTTVPNVFMFSVTDKEIVSQVQAKLESGDRAVLHYSQKILPPFCWRRTAYVIDGVH